MTANIFTTNERCALECRHGEQGNNGDVRRCRHGRIWIWHRFDLVVGRWYRVSWFWSPVIAWRASRALKGKLQVRP